MRTRVWTNKYLKFINILLTLSNTCRNVQCGSLQCKDGDRTPIIDGWMEQLYSRTIISIKGIEYECKCVKKIH